jgi:hypothetical protein
MFEGLYRFLAKTVKVEIESPPLINETMARYFELIKRKTYLQVDNNTNLRQEA